MPAAAVIPALIAYIKVVAVKKLIVGFWKNILGLDFPLWTSFTKYSSSFSETVFPLY